MLEKKDVDKTRITCQACIHLKNRIVGKRGGIRGYCEIRRPNEQRAGRHTACRLFYGK